MLAFIVMVSVVLLGLGYKIYGKWLSRRFSLDPQSQTPACEINDGQDFVPARPFFLIGQHFSAIAAAGPIVGPILAGLWFGWLPVLLWVVLGSILIGGVHDFTSLIGSVRHRGASIGELVKKYISPNSQVIFLIFIWLALVYVIIAFTDITAQTFRIVSQGSHFGPAVAFSSGIYLVLGLLMGLALRFTKLSLGLATVIFLPLVIMIVLLSPSLPPDWLAAIGGITAKQWDVILLIYCLVASLIPVWLLLQPRGYLGGWFLYLTIGVALLGALFGGFPVKYPALNLQGLSSLVNGKLIFPILFITVACGACSGFHGIVSSGTTSKQLACEPDALPVGYGAMLLEAVVAVLALGTLMILGPNDPGLKQEPNFIYAQGLAKYLQMIGVDFNLALTFALLAFSTFVYDTLDVCTRLARYILQELFGLSGRGGAWLTTLITLLVPLCILLSTREKGYLVAWPIFGTSNQLLASLILMAVSAWLIKTGKPAGFALWPMGFMLFMTLWSLGLQVWPFFKSAPGWMTGQTISFDLLVSGISGSLLLILSVWLLFSARKVFWRRST